MDFLRDSMCGKCQVIPTLKSFRKRILRRKEERDASKIRNNYLTVQEREVKLQALQDRVKKKESKVFLLTQENQRLKRRRHCLKVKLAEYSKRGSMKAVCHQLNRAAQEGKLESENVLKEVLATCGNNICKKKQGKRYNKTVKEFYEVLMYWGGPLIATFVALNLLGPEVHTLYCWRKKKDIDLEEGIVEENFVKITRIYEEALNTLSLGKVPVQLSEDETAIVRRVCYDQKNDTLVGFCGLAGDNHACKENCVIVIGDGEEGYNTIIQASKSYIIGSYGRLIMINPLHPSLPKIPILIMPTCNTFDNNMVCNQMERIMNNYDKYIAPVLGPLVGPSSDGERRRKVFLMLMRNVIGNRYQPIPRELGFILTCEKVFLDDGTYIIRNNCDQDSIHNHKKLVNHLDHQSRSMRMGKYLVHLNHVL